MISLGIGAYSNENAKLQHPNGKPVNFDKHRVDICLLLGRGHHARIEGSAMLEIAMAGHIERGKAVLVLGDKITHSIFASFSLASRKLTCTCIDPHY
jgi:hypothetical protein